MSVTELDKMKRKRTTLKGMCTKLINQINVILVEPVQGLKLQEFESQLQKLQIKENEILEVEEKIETQIETLDDLQGEIETRQEYRDQIIDVKLKLIRAIENIKSPSALKNVQNQGNDHRTNFQTESSSSSSVKLPKISIPHYEGSPENWLEFWSQYEVTIHKNTSLSNVEKFVYLRSFLKPPALTAIQGLALSESNYNTAIDLLKTRFGKNDIIIRYKIDALLNLNSVKSANQIKELRSLHDALDINIKSLENLGVDLKSYGNLLFPIVTKLIPTSIMIDYNRSKTETDEWDVQDLLKYLKLEVQTREKTFLFLKRETETYSNSYKNSNTRFENKHSGTSDFPYRKSASGYKNSNSIPKASAFKLTVSKCIFCVDEVNDHDSKACRLNIEDKKLALRKQGICYLCFKRGKHLAKNCMSGLKCELCLGRHNTLLCYKQNSEAPTSDEITNKNQIEKPRASKNSYESNTSGSDNSVISYKCSVKPPLENNEIFLQACFARITNKLNLNSLKCIVMFDSASQRNFINASLAQELKLPIVRKETLIIYSFSCDQPQKKEYSVVAFELSNLKNKGQRCIVEALVVNQISYTKLKICDEITVQNIFSITEKEKKSFPEMKAEFPDVLIGAGLYWQLYKNNKKISHSLFAVETTLGWTVSGNIADVKSSQIDVSIMKVECVSSDVIYRKHNCLESSDSGTANDLQNLWALDAIGIKSDTLLSDSDQQIINEFENQLEFKEGHYVTHLLWKDKSSDKMGNNFENAKRQFDSLWKRLKRDKLVFEEYKKIINEQEQLGIVEECDRSENEYFAPHREVLRKDKKTTKVRIVFNCSSKISGCESLNDCLVQGPSLTPPILDVINRFRMFKIAFCADIEKAFLMIGIAESDRNFLKFLWFDDNTQNYKLMRMARVTFGCTTSPFFLTATIKKHIKDYREKYPETYEMLNSALFVDDLLFGSSTVNEAYELTSSAVRILGNAGMKLRKFNTNSEELKNMWDKNDCFSEVINDSVINILGMVWDKDSDKLGLAIQSIVENLDISLCTKRYVLHTAAKFFDPIGIISPFLIRIKCFLQKLWIRGIDWDQELPQDLKGDWINWCNEIRDLLPLRIERCHFSQVNFSDSRIELHIFSDASPLAYGCVAYFKVFSNDKDCYVSMIMSKARVAPLKKLTLPRLELMGAVIAARIAQYISNLFKEIKIEKFYWTDSTIVLHWVKGTAKEWKPFVKNRVVEIQGLTEPKNWSYCNTKDNPADLVTRGVSAKALINNEFWFKGPDWLSEVNVKVNEDCEKFDTSEIIGEKRKTEKIVQLNISIETVEPILNIENYSNIVKVLRVTAWIKRFCNNINSKNEKIQGPLSAEEIDNARKVWVKFTQNSNFRNELICLEKGEPISRNSSLLEFSPFLDSDGLMRISGRLQKSKFSFNEKHPIILPSKGKLIELLIRNAHDKVFHFGINDTLVQLREEFWVIKGRQAVKRVLKKCSICRRYNARAGAQIEAPLPLDRIQEQKPFSVIGIDFAGPLFIRNSDHRYYILLCTCAVTRAVHLELVENLSTETFLLAFRRLVARRGLCHTVYSDNARTFHRAERELRAIWKIISHPDVKNYYSCNRIKWKFIVELSPWWGGFYERMVRSVKTALRKVVGKTRLSLTQLQTVLTEIEASINSRPLTHVFSTFGEPTPITPAHFLVGQRLTALPIVHMKSLTIPGTSDAYIKRFNLKERVLDHLWSRWKKEYLLQLKSAMTNRPFPVREFSVNDVVLIHDDKLPRHLWKLGLVTQVFTGRDGKVRSCQLKTATGNLKRPFQLIYPLELSNT